MLYYSGETGYTHSLSPSRPPNNTLNTRQQRTQVQGHISHTPARADRRVPRVLRVRSGRSPHSRPRFPLYSQALQPTQVAPNRSCCGHVIVMSGLELQLTSLSTGVGETNLAFGPRPQAPKKLKKSNSYTRFCEELC